MKSVLKGLFTIGILLSLGNVYSQKAGNGTLKTPVKESGAAGNAVAIELKNLSEKNVTIFVGPKTEIKNTKAKQKVYGGLSTNTIYVSINEVVCIISTDGKATSCADVHQGVTKMEVNKSGMVINGR